MLAQKTSLDPISWFAKALLTTLILSCFLFGFIQSVNAESINNAISGLMPDFGDVEYFTITLDSRYAVYVADQQTDNLFEVFSVPLDGSNSPIHLGGTYQYNKYRVYPLGVTNSRVVFVSDGNLVSVPIEGGPATTLTQGLSSESTIRDDFQVTPDSTHVVYRACFGFDNLCELYSVPVVGGTVVKLNSTLVPGGNVYTFGVSPDSSKVIYISDQEAEGVNELFSVSMQGGPTTKLNPPIKPDHGIDLFRISNDSKWVLFRSDQVYSVPITGGKINQLSIVPAPEGRIIGYKISYDSRQVVYWADQDTDNLYELYSVRIEGGVATKLNSPLAAERSIYQFNISHNSNRVVFLVDQEALHRFELYSVPLEGGTVMKLNDSIPLNSQITDFVISPDGAQVVYRVNKRLDSVPITGGQVVALNESSGFTLNNFHFSPDSKYVFFQTCLLDNLDQKCELYEALAAGGTPIKINGPYDSMITSLISSDYKWIVLLGDQRKYGVYELFAIPYKQNVFLPIVRQ